MNFEHELIIIFIIFTYFNNNVTYSENLSALFCNLNENISSKKMLVHGASALLCNTFIYIVLILHIQYIYSIHLRIRNREFIELRK